MLHRYKISRGNTIAHSMKLVLYRQITFGNGEPHKVVDGVRCLHWTLPMASTGYFTCDYVN